MEIAPGLSARHWRRRWQRRVAPIILNLRSESRASHQQHGKETPGENVERKAEAWPPHRDTGILNEQMMKEVENSVSGESSQHNWVLERLTGYERTVHGQCSPGRRG
jgi:hypothetical protein